MSRIPKVSDSQVIAIRQRRKAGELLKVLAYDFGLNMNYVCRLCNFRDRKNAKVQA